MAKPMYETSCGQGNCLCSFALFDFELAKAWLSTAKEYLGICKKPHKELPVQQILMPCKLTTLADHDMCFQQWSVVQLWMGFVTAFVAFVTEIIFMDKYGTMSFGTILMNLIFRSVWALLIAHLCWFGVVKKHGCCCLLCCCCIGKPDLIATGVILAISGVWTIIQAFDLLGTGWAPFILLALFILVQATTQFFLSFEAFMIWKLTTGEAKGEPSKGGADLQMVGAPSVFETIADEAGMSKDPTLLAARHFSAGAAPEKMEVVPPVEKPKPAKDAQEPNMAEPETPKVTSVFAGFQLPVKPMPTPVEAVEPTEHIPGPPPTLEAACGTKACSCP
jgi:hypothetical protein